ncbi:MAG: carbohydrate kinase [Clostridia bacterium]|nr:carbohydrate kinase [Clostridia bacterium]
MYIGGLDVGTTGCKLTVCKENGDFVYNSYQEYEANRCGGEHEIDAENIFNAVCHVISDTAKKYELKAIGVTTFGETFTALDKNDKPLMPSMLYTDPRGAEETKELCNRLGERTVTDIAGVKPNSMYSIPKIMWIKKYKSEVYKNICRIMLMEDYIVYMLTGIAQIDYSLAARTMGFDIRKKCWSEDIFKAAGVDVSLMSMPVKTGTVAGEIKPEIRERLGIDYTIQIVSGCHDQVAACVGAGVFTPGEAVDGTGTVECITPVFDSIPKSPEFYDKGYCAVPYVFDNTYVCYAFSFTGGAAVKWFRDNFGKELSYSELDNSTGKEPTGILIMPHFAGAATPYMDSGSRATIIGLTLEHSRGDVYKAVMEGVTYEIMLNIDTLRKFGVTPQSLYATGGGAKSRAWLQIKADILNRQITALKAEEAGACGTCMLTATAIGIYKDLVSAKEAFVKLGETFIPNKEKTARYGQLYNAYKKIYIPVREIIRGTENE